jgi:hypothetical protein
VDSNAALRQHAYPSYVVAGELVATAVVQQLREEPEFEKDVACAKQEHAAEGRSDGKLTPACEARELQLMSKEQPLSESGQSHYQ